jgi:tripartite-type tricarboxylate transporter receptor subunit TctC
LASALSLNEFKLALPWRNLRRADMILRADARMRIGPTRRSVLALIGSLAPAAAFAAYPERPIKLVVALAPGGPADTAARLFAPYFSERLGQSVVIENRTGASSVVGTESVVRAPPDGYTLLFGSSSSFAVNPAVMKNLRFDVRTDLTLVGLVSYTPHVLVVRAGLAANTLAELIALARTQPGKLTYASSGAGGAIHLASELFKHEAGVAIVHVPYRGGGPAVMGLLTGDVDIFINDASTTVENVRAGKLKALAVAASTRSPLLPQVPTFAELGFPAMVSSGGAGEYARRRHRRLGHRDAFRLCVGELSGWAAKARPRTIQLEPRTVRRLHHGGVRQMGQGREVRRYPGGLGRSHQPNQGAHTPES